MIPYLAETPVLETARLILRAPIASDWEPALAFMVTQRAQYMGGPYERSDAWRGFNHVVGHWVTRGYGMFTYCDKTTGRPMGFVGPFYPEGWTEPEIGWSIWSSEDEGKGFVLEAAQAARGYVYEVLNWSTAISYIDPDNARSMALARRLGCEIDPNGTLPDGKDWPGTLVFRHPSPDTFVEGGVEAYA